MYFYNILLLIDQVQSRLKLELLKNCFLDYSKSYIHHSVTFQNIHKIRISRGCQILNNVFMNGKSNCETGITLGENVRIRENTYIDSYNGSIVLEDSVFIGPNCMIYGHGGLIIKKNTMIAGHTIIIPSNHNFNNYAMPIRAQGETMLGICIGENVWIGANCTILDGVHIGDNSVIGAGSIVTKNIPSYSVAVGNPCKVIKKRSQDLF